MCDTRQEKLDELENQPAQLPGKELDAAIIETFGLLSLEDMKAVIAFGTELMLAQAKTDG
jgi:hypothetical protein